MIAIKKALKRLALSIGYDINKLPPKGFYKPHHDAYADQQHLLRGREPKVVFDLGAHKGETVMRYHDLFPRAEIYCFEPSENAYAVLSETIAAKPAIKAYKKAIGREPGRRKLYLNAFDETNSLLPVAGESARYISPAMTTPVGSIDVEMVSLDDFCNENGITGIDLMKIDVQGGELMALEGAAKLLQTHSIGLIYTEANYAQMYQGQASFDEVMGCLRRYGYVLYGLYNFSYGKNEVLTWGDAIFISPAIEKSLPCRP